MQNIFRMEFCEKISKIFCPICIPLMRLQTIISIERRNSCKSPECKKYLSFLQGVYHGIDNFIRNGESSRTCLL